MVAISLYRGNLHKVPDVPRRWLMPTPKISLKDFKILLHRRTRALSRIHSTTTTTTIATTSDPNPNSNLKQEEEDFKHDDDNTNCEASELPQSDPFKVEESEEEKDVKGGGLEGEVKDEKGSVDGDCSEKQLVDGCDAASVKDKHVVLDNESIPLEANGIAQEEKKEAPLLNPNSETINKEDGLNDKEKRKREIEEKLQILNAKKHNLVQMLKQILNAEEELKRRSSMPGFVVRPSVSLQVDVSNDSGSMTRHVSPRMGSEGNLGGDMGGAEVDDVSNQNMHSRQFLRTSSISPSSHSPHRRSAFNAVPLASRAALGVAGSPSRFAPTGQQGHPANLPSVSVSGTNYIASSPSPAASGGTSVFRDGRLPSPWN